ncbi:MAG: HAMP domain-containing protein [Acidobacteria bacterium]|nr:HAMP domain-containing protein [Acidobacteriota bacterium]MBV9475451.1 HAMP domain-containing protein [Acidobacteriota bacterium]
MIVQSIRGRLTAWYTLVLGIVLVATGWFTYALIRAQVRRDTDAALASTTREVIRALVDESAENHDTLDAEPASVVLSPLREKTRAVAVFTSDGRLLASSDVGDAHVLDVAHIGQRVQRGRAGYDTRHRVRALLTPAVIAGTRATIVVAQTLTVQDALLADLRRAMMLAIPLALLVASLGGYLLARKSLAPVAAMGRKAAAIGASDLAERIDVANPHDELGELATTLNGLLARVEEAFASQRRFMADASHELRTPVAILQGEIDVALARELRDPADYRESLAIMRKSVRRLARIVGDLFLIARSDAGEFPVQRERFYLDEVVAQTVHSFRTLAAERSVVLREEHEPELPIEGDSDLVQRMLGNLIENAIRHTPADATVFVRTTASDARYTIEVCNDGAPIPPAMHEAIFARFVRVDAARGASHPSLGSGAGLGLPIARWIAETHGGTLRLERSDASGTRFVVALPR